MYVLVEFYRIWFYFLNCKNHQNLDSLYYFGFAVRQLFRSQDIIAIHTKYTHTLFKLTYRCSALFLGTIIARIFYWDCNAGP